MNAGRSKTVTTDDALAVFEESSLPFITSKFVANEYDCSQKTARTRLNEIVESGQLERYNLDERRTLYFRPNYEAAEEILESLHDQIDLSSHNADQIEAFVENPYKILPKSKEEYYVIVPRFIPFHVGHLHEQDEAWQVFVVNKYISWIDDLPDEIRDQVDISQRFDHATVEGRTLELSGQEEREEAWDVLGGRDGGLHKRVDDRKIQIQRGHEFEVIASLIDEGNLPFTADPVRDHDLRSEPEKVSLRSYQESAWENFREYGRIGVYWPPGAGKTFFTLYAGERVDGDKLVVVPTSTLEEQWENRIEEFCERPSEWDVRTYQYLTYGDNMQNYTGTSSPSLFVADECHRLPANTFSKLATIDSDYRIGLSATPYREDDRTDYIFALTGFPVGIDWQELVELGVVDYPTAHVYLYRTMKQKRRDVIDLAEKKPGEGIIFCDSLEEGSLIADKIGVPFVSGDTPKSERMSLVSENRVAVVSRVGDEGLSLEELDWSIEYNFHGGSRRQELQRAGRVMHSDKGRSQHIIQMTDEEVERYSDRLYSLEEKGIEIQYERRD